MSFVTYDRDGLPTQNKKQSIRLSRQAWEVIDNDMMAIGEFDDKQNKSGFLNRIFLNFYPHAKTSIAYQLNVYKGTLQEQLADESIDKKAKNTLIKALIKVRESELLSEKDKYATLKMGESFLFWLNEDAVDYLSGEDSECCEERFYDRRSQYFRCVIEEYARLPYVQREMVFFANYDRAINEAQHEKCRLRIRTRHDKIFSVLSYGVYQDPLSSANYLVGYSIPHGTDEAKRPCSFRIKGIREMTLEKSKSGFLDKEEKYQLEELISARGVQFLVGNNEEICVRLSQNGVQQYRQQIHLRPDCIKIRNGSEYVFYCTAMQAYYYFFKFGKDAEILSPLDLREDFAQKYLQAAETYLK